MDEHASSPPCVEEALYVFVLTHRTRNRTTENLQMQEVWTRALEDLRAELPEHIFNTWLKPLRFSSATDECVVVEVPNNFYRDRLSRDYLDLLRERLHRQGAPASVGVDLIVPPPNGGDSLLRNLTRTKREVTRQEAQLAQVEGLNRRYTFESFVVGSNNEFAHAAAQAVASAPGQTYNPLFIYGGVGLGKTHLLSAIGNRILSERPGTRIVFKTAERFMNELINAIRLEKTVEFRNCYRESCDLLLIDDIQFIGGKERTQDEFFHTFNALHEGGNQIVLTSDQYPTEIPQLDERLRSRFQWGLQCDIQPPDVETRVAIVKQKADALAVVVPDDVAFYLANHIKSNVRVLEGALIRVAAFASISHRPITLDLTKEVFQSLATDTSTMSVELIQKRVAEFFSITVADLRSSRRHKAVVLPRQIAMYLGRKLTSSSFPNLGDRFGGKDHTTVMHAVSKIERLLKDDGPMQKIVATLEQTLS